MALKNVHAVDRRVGITLETITPEEAARRIVISLKNVARKEADDHEVSDKAPAVKAAPHYLERLQKGETINAGPFAYQPNITDD